MSSIFSELKALIEELGNSPISLPAFVKLIKAIGIIAALTTCILIYFLSTSIPKVLVYNPYWFTPADFLKYALIAIVVTTISFVIIYLSSDLVQQHKEYSREILFQNTEKEIATWDDEEKPSNSGYDLTKIDIDKAVGESIEKVTNHFFNSYEEELKQFSNTNLVSEPVSKHIYKLERILITLGKRANVNLVIGIAISISGIAMLYFFVSQHLSEMTPEKFTYIFLPRLSLVIIIETFAYFFLKLYKSTLAEIKYFQNEITNIVLKNSAITACLLTESAPSFQEILLELIKTDRNAILEKGQTTASIELAKIDNQNTNAVSEKLTNLLANNN